MPIIQNAVSAANFAPFLHLFLKPLCNLLKNLSTTSPVHRLHNCKSSARCSPFITIQLLGPRRHSRRLKSFSIPATFWCSLRAVVRSGLQKAARAEAAKRPVRTELGSKRLWRTRRRSLSGHIDGTVLSTAVFPILFREDPLYFRLGRGTIRHRVFYSLATTFLPKTTITASGVPTMGMCWATWPRVLCHLYRTLQTVTYVEIRSS